MKKALFLIINIFVLLSCSTYKEIEENDFIGKWENKEIFISIEKDMDSDNLYIMNKYHSVIYKAKYNYVSHSIIIDLGDRKEKLSIKDKKIQSSIMGELTKK